MLQIWEVSKDYQLNGRKVRILDDVSLKVEDGRFLAILGASGCGKTTLLRIVAGLEEANEGKVFFRGEEITKPSAQWGMVFQDHALFPWRNVRENVELGLEIKGLKKEERRELAVKYLTLVGLSDHLTKLPNELSGGMKHRVALARTLASNPSMFLMDEPFAALDTQTKKELQRELLQIWSMEKKMVLFVTHDVEEAAFLADMICVLSSCPGRVKEVVVNHLPRNEDCSRSKGKEFYELKERLLSLIDKGW
jgi:NitT/TauT family transport system ATP-binding protein